MQWELFGEKQTCVSVCDDSTLYELLESFTFLQSIEVWITRIIVLTSDFLKAKSRNIIIIQELPLNISLQCTNFWQFVLICYLQPTASMYVNFCI